MSSILITAALLGDAGVTALVGTRCALAQLPPDTAMPAVVYQIVSDSPEHPINSAAGPQRMRSRAQITALAATPAGVEALLAAVRTACGFKSGTYAGKAVIATLRDIAGPITKDNEAGVWYGSQDFVLHWFD